MIGHRSAGLPAMRWLLAILVLFGGFSMAAAQPADRPNEFFRNAIISARFELEATRLALSKSQETRIQDLAAGISDENKGILERLEQAAAHLNAPVPQDLDASRQAWLRDLQKKDGAEFENAFLTGQIESYSQTVTEYRNYTRNGSDPQVKEVAGELLKILQARQAQIKGMKGL